MQRNILRAISVATLFIIASIAIPKGRSAGSIQYLAPQANPLEYETSIEVGGNPDALAVDCCDGRNDIAFYDSSSGSLRFLDGYTLTLAPEVISLPTWEWLGWLRFDRSHQHIYVLTTRTRTTGMEGWEEVRVHIVADRAAVSTFSVNDVYNALNPVEDNFYTIDGVVLEQSNTEGGNPARLIINNTYEGRFDVVDLNGAGTAAALRQRAAYRSQVTGPSYLTVEGNSLALETNHETLASDDLTSTDLLYISDVNHDNVGGGTGWVRVAQIGQPLSTLNATFLSEIDLNGTFPFMNGLEGLEVAAPRDQLYINCDWQSFANGYLGKVSTVTHGPLQVINLTYSNTGFVTDWYDTKQIFVATWNLNDMVDPTPPLYLHLVYDQTVVYSMILVNDYNGSFATELRSMVYDPYYRRLYISIGTKIMVINVNYGSSPPPPGSFPAAYLPIARK